MKDFSGKTVYVVGGSSGIGLSIARKMSRRGAHVIIFARQKSRLEDAVKQIADCGLSEAQRFSYMQVDVSREDDVKTVMSEAVLQFGVPEVLINCAGTVRPDYFERITCQQFDVIMKSNLYGAWHTIAALLHHMKKQGGYIVNVSSMSGLIGAFGYTDYCASKFALIGFSEALRSELKQYGVKVSVLCPPDTDTPLLYEENKTKPEETKALTAKASLMQPDEVAEALIKGMKRNSFLIIPGFEGKMLYLLKRLFPGLVEFSIDREIKKVRTRKTSEP
jgi:3-dehydrosphinganine reductase